MKALKILYKKRGFKMKKLSKKRVVSTLLLAVMVSPLTSVTNLQTVIKAQTQT